MELEKIKIYRMIHIENIPHVLQHGITHKKSENTNPNFISIGDTSLIDSRSTREVLITNGNLSNVNSYNIVLGNYIPFYFGVRMPMLYVIQIGGNFVEKATPPGKIIYLAYDLMRIVESGNSYYFSDGHATDNFTTFYDNSKIDELPKIVNWNAIRTKYWGGAENLNLKRKKQAEFLVSNDLPEDGIFRYVCHDNSAKERLESMGIAEERIKIYPKAYY